MHSCKVYCAFFSCYYENQYFFQDNRYDIVHFGKYMSITSQRKNSYESNTPIFKYILYLLQSIFEQMWHTSINDKYF